MSMYYDDLGIGSLEELGANEQAAIGQPVAGDTGSLINAAATGAAGLLKQYQDARLQQMQLELLKKQQGKPQIIQQPVNLQTDTGSSKKWWVVAAVVGGLALAGGAAFFISKRKKAANSGWKRIGG